MVKYKVLKEREIRGTIHAKEGDVVYRCASHDYGCASYDTRFTGVDHISVTANEDGSYPFFTIPRKDLEKLDG